MGDTALLLQFSFFIVFALFGTVLSIRLRQPYVVGLLVFGMLAGPHVFGVVSDTSLISTFSELGAILMLFTVGIEFSVSRIIKSGMRAVLVTMFKMGLLFLLGYEAALHFGFDLTGALVAGAMLSITSTAIMFKTVSEKGMAKNKTMPLLFSMLIVEDLVAVAALTFFSSLGAGTPTYEDKFVSVLISLGLLGGFYLLVRRHASNAIYRLTSSFSEEVMIFVAFSLCLTMSLVASYVGLTPAIGAFLAGSILSALPNVKKIEKTLHPLLLMFTALFFLSLGMNIDPAMVAGNLAFAVALAAVFVIVCFASVFSLLYVTGSDAKNSLFGASSMVVLGEFSLLIASVYTGQFAPLLIAAGSFGVVVTAIISSFLLDRQEQLLQLEARYMPAKLKSAGESLSLYFTGLIRDFSPSGSFWKVSHICWDCISRKLAAIAVIAVAVAILRFAIHFFNLAAGQTALQLRLGILGVGIIGFLYFGIGILFDLRPMLDALSHAIARHKKDANDESIILRDAAVALLLMAASLNANDFVNYLKLPPPFDLVDDTLFVLSLVFLWDLVSHAGNLTRASREKRRKRLLALIHRH